MEVTDIAIAKPINEDEYNELLRQAVAVIEASRTQIAKQLNTMAMSSYWEICKLLEQKKLDIKYIKSTFQIKGSTD
jgi:hypothetical protein